MKKRTVGYPAIAAVALLVTPFLSQPAAASSILQAIVTGDDQFTMYVGTGISAPLTLVGSGTTWAITYSFDTTLTANTDYYLQIVVNNTGGPGGLLGQFTLTGTNYQFANGTQTLLTNGTNNWLESVGNLKLPATSAVLNDGPNSASQPEGLHSLISTSADWIWSPALGSQGLGYVTFEALVIYIPPVAPPPSTPEPGTFALMGGVSAALVVGRFLQRHRVHAIAKS